ncbi:hypothetical protein [Variovorax soli]|uniref:4-amino-4-deoxy-L-arabinose transferase n=1 Tax=Variovorax soli TaxID=376815 RepID=A0ABU1NBY5_9BURK|nr:hypothetical protein [Variovorax soli]MDR6535949.1 hypothetical protein [Variovorax soli]
MQRPVVLHVVFPLAILLALCFRFAPYIQSLSFDLAQHYFLVDEIMKHGTIRPPPIPNITTMAIYPPASHWMAAVIGWIGGSGLVAITLVTISAVFLSYLLIARLVGAHKPIAIIVFGIFFVALIRSRSLIGWEVIENYFYPQLVADVVYLGTLLWLTRSSTILERTIIVVSAGVATMWIQPLVALHIFAAGAVLLALECLALWRARASSLKWCVLALLGVLAAGVVVVAIHPAFQVMRMISANNGGLNLGYSDLMLVTSASAAIGALNLWRWLAKTADFTDAVLGSAVIAASSMALLQFVAWKLNHDGSLYAVKKHMFLIVTLGAMNAARLVALRIHLRQGLVSAQLLSPIAAGLASLVILHSFTTPVRPIVDAINYANNAAQFRWPAYQPGTTLAEFHSDFVDGLVSFTSFEFPFDAKGIAWLQRQTKAVDIAAFVMVKRSPQLDAACKERFAESATFAIVPVACLKEP